MMGYDAFLKKQKKLYLWSSNIVLFWDLLIFPQEMSAV